MRLYHPHILWHLPHRTFSDASAGSSSITSSGSSLDSPPDSSAGISADPSTDCSLAAVSGAGVISSEEGSLGISWLGDSSLAVVVGTSAGTSTGTSANPSIDPCLVVVSGAGVISSEEGSPGTSWLDGSSALPGFEFWLC